MTAVAEVGGGGGGGGIVPDPDPLGRLLSSALLPSAVIFLGLFFYRARVLEISPFSLEKPVACYATPGMQLACTDLLACQYGLNHSFLFFFLLSVKKDRSLFGASTDFFYIAFSTTLIWN